LQCNNDGLDRAVGHDVDQRSVLVLRTQWAGLMHIKAVTLRYSYIPFANLLRKNDNTKGAKEVGGGGKLGRPESASRGSRAEGPRRPLACGRVRHWQATADDGMTPT
jgi:hypothetical protein